MNGTVGAYYRRTYDMQPQLMLTPGLATVPSPAVCAGIGGQPLAPSSPTPCIINRYATNQADLLQKGRFGAYNLAFGEDIDIFGLSLSKNIAGVSVGAELSYRDNMPLISDPVVVLPAPLVPTTPGSISTENVPKSGTPGATGETLHGVLNLLGLVGETALWDAANWATELTWMQWLDVQQNEAVFKGRKGYEQIDAVDKNFFGLAVNFTPTWFQVLPSVDMLAPVTWSQGISGNSAVTSGGSGRRWHVLDRHRGRRPPEVSFRPEVHRVLRRRFEVPAPERSESGDVHQRRHRHFQRCQRHPGGPGFHRADVQNHLLTRKQT